MNSQLTISGVVTDAVGHYSHAAKNLVAAARTASERTLASSSKRYADLVARSRLPIIDEKRKARLVAAERRVAQVVGEGVARIAQGYDRGIELVSGQALKGLGAFAQRTQWAKDMFVVDTARRINLPAAKLSLELAKRIDEATSALSTRAAGTPAHRAAKPAAKAASRAKRVRRAA